MKSTKSLSRLYNLEITPYINRVCKLSENKYRRIRKNTTLPENNQIEQYLHYLLEKISLHYTRLKRQYSFDDWHRLGQYILVALVVFNRKRPGETQRLELEDFNQKESVSQKDMEERSEEEKLQAHKYVRVAFRGKLGNSTALLIDKLEILPGIEILLQYRMKAVVHPENKYLFAYPSSKDRNKTYDAYRCHHQLLDESGFQSVSLTFTNLRKQFATQVARDAPSQEEELRISNYMSHDYNIHKRIYDQSTPLIDITRVSKHLEASAKQKTKSITSETNRNQLINKNKNISIKRKQARKKASNNRNDIRSSEEENTNPLKTRCSGNKRKHDESNDYIPNSSENEELDPKVQRSLDITRVSKRLEASAKQKSKSITNETNQNQLINKNKNISIKRKQLRKKSSNNRDDIWSSEENTDPLKTRCSGNKRKYSESDDYTPSEEPSSSSENEEELDPKIQRSFGKFKQRKLWTTQEKEVTRKYFQNEISMKRLADKKKIKEFKEKYADLMTNRSVPMISQWIEGEINKHLLKEQGVTEKRPRYSTPEKMLLEKSLERYSLTGSEPSIEESQDLINSNDILKRRTPQSVLQKLKYMIKEKQEFLMLKFVTVRRVNLNKK